ncbi:MAG: hypothetical protein U1E76_21730, partial [Planctomycetota bacterium]
MGADDIRIGVSDATGYFELDGPVPPGTWPIDLTGTRGFELIGPNCATADPSSVALELEIVVRTMRSIAGVVTTANNAPVRVLLGTSGGGMAWTRDDESFRIFGSSDAPDQVQLKCLDSGLCDNLD